MIESPNKQRIERLIIAFRNIFTLVKATWDITSGFYNPTILKRILFMAISIKPIVRLGMSVKQSIEIEIEFQDYWGEPDSDLALVPSLAKGSGKATAVLQWDDIEPIPYEQKIPDYLPQGGDDE